MNTRKTIQTKKPKNLFRALIIHPLQEFLQIEAIGGILLMIATGTAMVWANPLFLPAITIYGRFRLESE